MSDRIRAGWALIVGAAAGVLTMAVHPSAGAEHLTLVSGAAHALAIASVVFLFLGACGLAAELRDRSRVAFGALALFGLGCVVVTVAAAISGWAVPGALAAMGRDVPEAGASWRIAIAVLFQLNQACSRIYAVLVGAAIVLWSVVGLRTGRLGAAASWFGVLSGGLVGLLVAVGHIRLNIHGMGLVMFSEAVWFVWIAVGLVRGER